jgi:hypothetical protein
MSLPNKNLELLEEGLEHPLNPTSVINTSWLEYTSSIVDDINKVMSSGGVQ